SFQGRRRLVDVVTGEGQARLESERIAGSEAGRLEAEWRSRFHERVPDRDCAVIFAENLYAVFARVACARQGDALAAQGSPSKSEGLERLFEVLERSIRLGQNLEGFRALEREQRGVFTLVRDAHSRETT